MKIAIRLTGTEEQLKETMNKLDSIGQKFKRVKNGIVIYPSDKTYPEVLKPDPKTLRILESESGGYDPEKKTGRATVVCSVFGKKIRPFYVDPETRPFGGAALFALHGQGAKVTAKVSQSGTEVQIVTMKSQLKDGGRISLVRNLLWDAPIEHDLPEYLSHFRDAIDAAVEKANCPNCCKVHFAGETQYTNFCKTKTK